ncbi:MAG: aminoacyl-tRNA hydrolase [Planctomycetia bacterium]|nr:aminoacyl-tRNA hydrolase [Planctomycetia bacterium]
MKAIVGLGNPGNKYAGTRHNVGFAVIDMLAAGPGVGRFQERFQAEIAEAGSGEGKLLLVKPQTFMNLSGLTVRQLLDFYKLPPEELLVVCDDFNLPLGKLRFRRSGTHGGHNGLRNIQDHLGSTDYARLRLGVGLPADAPAVDHVLGRFRPVELPVIREAVETAVQAAVLWAEKGIDACMNRYNG